MGFAAADGASHMELVEQYWQVHAFALAPTTASSLPKSAEVESLFVGFNCDAF